MSQRYNLYIPPYVPIESIILILGRFYGDENMKKKTFSAKEINMDKPSSNSNHWHFNYKVHNEKLEYTYTSIIFTTAVLGKNKDDLKVDYYIH